MSLPVITGGVFEHRRDLPNSDDVEWALVRQKLYKHRKGVWQRIELKDGEVKLFLDACREKLYLVQGDGCRRSRSRSHSPVPTPVVPDCIVAPNGSAQLCATDAGNLDGFIANDLRIFFTGIGPSPPGTITIFDYDAPLGTLIVGNQCQPVIPATFGRNSITVGTGGCDAAPSLNGPHQAGTADSAVFGDHSLVRATPITTPSSDGASSVAIGSFAWANIRNSFAQGFGDTDLQGGHQKVTLGLVGVTDPTTGLATLGTIDNPAVPVTFPVPISRSVDAVVQISINGDIAVPVGAGGCLSVPHIDAVFYVGREAPSGTYYSCGLATLQIAPITPGATPFAPLINTSPTAPVAPTAVSPVPFDAPATIGGISFVSLGTAGFTITIENGSFGSAAGQTYHAALTYHSTVRTTTSPGPIPVARPKPSARFGSKF